MSELLLLFTNKFFRTLCLIDQHSCYFFFFFGLKLVIIAQIEHSIHVFFSQRQSHPSQSSFFSTQKTNFCLSTNKWNSFFLLAIVNCTLISFEYYLRSVAFNSVDKFAWNECNWKKKWPWNTLNIINVPCINIKANLLSK